VKEDPFSDREVRFGFIRKVYGILSCQLLFTCGFVLAVMNIPELDPIL
jgi:FtsH-binding integral membrane protein